MRYLALGDSISIDDYTGVVGGGAAGQFARLIEADLQNLTADGQTTAGVLESLSQVEGRPDVITLTAGGNDFLQAAFYGADPALPAGRAELVTEPLCRLSAIADRLTQYGCPVLLNTVYDPTDGDDGVGESLGLSTRFREPFNELNEGIRALAGRPKFILSDLRALFHGHGINAPETWIVSGIEPNHPGATAIARHWRHLYLNAPANPPG